MLPERVTIHIIVLRTERCINTLLSSFSLLNLVSCLNFPPKKDVRRCDVVFPFQFFDSIYLKIT